MYETEYITVSLTGPDSHTIVREPGVGSLTLGPADSRGPRSDLTVGANDRLDWSVFDPMTVPAGYPWPRLFRYAGNDTGFLSWSRERPVETFHWEPTGRATVDASGSRIGRLTLTLRTDPLHIVLPGAEVGCLEVAVIGDAGLFHPELAADATCPPLRFVPDTGPSPTAPPIALPVLDRLSGATNVDVWTTPLRQAFDCASLLQFPGIRNLSVAGQLAGLSRLANLTELSRLQLRYCPDLSELPPLASWPMLGGLIVSNVDEVRGRRLRTELKRFPWPNSWVRQLRKPEWFATEYGLPFTEWPRATARKARKAFDVAAAAVAGAGSSDEVEAAVRRFTAALNDLPGLYTIEREDAAEAVTLIAAKAAIEVGPEQALAWFDAERDF